MSATTDPTGEMVADGRRARRERGRLAVLDAMLDLVLEGHSPPTTEQVAERAGVSVASLFRYFETLDDLRERAIEHCFERYSPLLEIPDLGAGTLEDRIRRLVGARVDLYETTSPVGHLLRERAPETAQAGAALDRLRAARTDQLRHHFADELDGLTPAARDDLVATIATITSFEAWDRFRNHHGRSPAQTRRAWAAALGRLLHDHSC